VLNLLRRREVLLGTYSERSAENERRAHDELFGIKNSRKLYVGRMAGLQDPAVLKKKAEAEAALRQKVAGDPQMQAAYGDAWKMVDDALASDRAVYVPYSLVERGFAFNSSLFRIARGLVRMTEESQKPNAERLREYRQSNLESLQQQLYSSAPVYKDLETVTLADSLSHWLQVAGRSDPLIQQAFGDKSPTELASALVRGTRLDDVAVRKSLGEGGKAAIDASNDPMIAFARLVDARARELRKQYEDTVEEPLRQAYSKIANATFHAGTGATYPDATFTLRLAFGTVNGYEENGEQVPWATSMAGAFVRAEEHHNQPPFNLPPSWLEKKNAIRGTTPFDFVSTADIIGGNSGSPVVNRAGEFVGIIFDGNLQSLPWDYQYDDRQGRAVSVDSAAIIEALSKVYGATDVLSELNGK